MAGNGFDLSGVHRALDKQFAEALTALQDEAAKNREAVNGLKSRVSELEAAKPAAPSRRRRQGDGDAPSGGA